MPSLKELIVAAPDCPRKVVEVPEWNLPEKIYVRALTGAEQSRMVELQDKHGKLNGRATIAAVALVDEQGNRVFSDDDVPLLNAKAGSSLDIIVDAYYEVNGLSEKKVEDAEKN